MMASDQPGLGTSSLRADQGLGPSSDQGLDSLLDQLEHTVSHQRREETVTRVTKHYSTSLHTTTRDQDSYTTDTNSGYSSSEQYHHTRQADITTMLLLQYDEQSSGGSSHHT